jgi:hypothetical protein
MFKDRNDLQYFRLSSRILGSLITTGRKSKNS